jgi:hypothetical protein
MTKFTLFALYLCLSASLLIIWPLMMHPTLPRKRKIILSLLTFFVLVPIGIVLYAILGVPQLAF